MSSIKLKSITLENLSQVTVASSASNVDRSYGRRFTVTMGNDSQEVVLKDLFKRAQKLAKKATSASELNEVNRFITKLEVAETAAAKTYSDRDDSVYKFRSWFHRFFGGAFFGTHLGRLGTLKNKVDSKQEKLLESFKTFFQEKQLTFRSFVNKPIEVEVDNQIFNVTSEVSDLEGMILKIQKKEEVGTDIGLLVVKKNPIDDEYVLEYEGLTNGIPPKFSIILSEISKEVEAREIKIQEFQRTLTLIRSVINRMDHNAVSQLVFDGKEYEISRSKYAVFPAKMYIQENTHKGTEIGLLSIHLNPQITDIGEFEFEGIKVPSIPEVMIPLYDAIVLRAYKRSSSYSGSKIRVIREGIKHNPEWHLNELCNRFKNDDSNNKLCVEFLLDTLEPEDGSDVGGVKRDYIATLASSLQEYKTLFASIEGNLKLPRILRENEGPMAFCNEKEARTYSNLGVLFSKCYKSSSRLQGDGKYENDLVLTGLHFSEAIFKAALSLQESEFAEHGIPEEEVYVKIAKVLLAHIDTEKTPTIKDIINCLDLTHETVIVLDPNDPILYQAALLAGEIDYTDDNGDPVIQKIQNDPKNFIQDLRAAIFKDTSLINELKGVPLGAMLDPVYQVANGLKSDTTNWSSLSSKSSVEVSNRIQGSIDRQKIASRITCTGFNYTVNKKAGWLKVWVEDEATDEEIKTFLKFVTGSASLPEGKKLEIKAQTVGQPFPSICTCALGISVSDQMSYDGWNKEMWDNTKEGFIRNLKQAMVIEGFQNR